VAPDVLAECLHALVQDDAYVVDTPSGDIGYLLITHASLVFESHDLALGRGKLVDERKDGSGGVGDLATLSGVEVSSFNADS